MQRNKHVEKTRWNSLSLHLSFIMEGAYEMTQYLYT